MSAFYWPALAPDIDNSGGSETGLDLSVDFIRSSDSQRTKGSYMTISPQESSQADFCMPAIALGPIAESGRDLSRPGLRRIFAVQLANQTAQKSCCHDQLLVCSDRGVSTAPKRQPGHNAPPAQSEAAPVPACCGGC